MLSHPVMSNSMWPRGLQPTRLLCPWNSPGKNTGVDCHFLLQGIFLTQGSNLCLLRLLHWQVDSLPSNHLGNPLLPDQGSTPHLCIGRWSINHSTTREILQYPHFYPNKNSPVPQGSILPRWVLLWPKLSFSLELLQIDIFKNNFYWRKIEKVSENKQYI